MRRIVAALAAAFLGVAMVSISAEAHKGTFHDPRTVSHDRRTPAPAASKDTCVCCDARTEMIKQACRNGPEAAKDAMKAFMKKAGIKSCNQCHTKLAPYYDLKPDAYAQFYRAGGK